MEISVDRKLRKRSDIKFEESNLPKPVEFDYSADISDRHFDVIDKAMRHKAGLKKEKLEAVLSEGILVSGEDW